ncbi:uncharacterized protein PHACADRAFT_202764 [Phanerochaete carnosa HHB-10118-sp]|uniref:Uncharacterized protein n=1 Tax=Phanerochaete carnosa (strain HHB-10118-sp) TaxID=650164 RepID=K5UG79_PHACS|nr:uncharacterized protein PHACADRAFT_202764 [Phanerochaete carnosa HHB-10118-sp]EKM48476.1 hypothetical protein PHACADRAFT_202764 [Phanerochaete carnosa HHB-10118-sp]
MLDGRGAPARRVVFGFDTCARIGLSFAWQEAQVMLNYLTALHDPCSREALA